MAKLAFLRPQLEDLFAYQLAERTQPIAAVTYGAASALSLAALVRCCATAAAASLTPRLAVLIAVAAIALAAHARALNIVARPSQVLPSEGVASCDLWWACHAYPKCSFAVQLIVIAVSAGIALEDCKRPD